MIRLTYAASSKLVYVASSWKNEHQQDVVSVLRHDGHDVYDFKDTAGFSWREIDPNWQHWSKSEYLTGLYHPAAERGFCRDMAALDNDVARTAREQNAILGREFDRAIRECTYFPPEAYCFGTDSLVLEAKEQTECLRRAKELLCLVVSWLPLP